MPVIHKQKLLFVHIPKTAGKSIEECFLGEQVEKNDYGARGKFNLAAKYFLNKTANKFARYNLLGSLDYVFSAAHMTMREILEYTPLTEREKGYISFSVVRNPYDRAVSSVLHRTAAKMSCGNHRTISSSREFKSLLSEWLDSPSADHNELAHRRSQLDFISLNAKDIYVDYLLRYEKLSSDLEAFVQKQNLEVRELKWIGRQRPARDYRDFYDDEAKKIVERQFGGDIEVLKYQF